MAMRLGVRTRILGFMIPVVLALITILTVVLYLAISQLLLVAARESATADVLGLADAVAHHAAADAITERSTPAGGRVLQLIDRSTGEIIGANQPDATLPLRADIPATPDLITVSGLPGVSPNGHVVASRLVSDTTGREVYALAAVPTRVGPKVLVQSAEIIAVGALAMVVLLAIALSWAVGIALAPVRRMREQVEKNADDTSMRPVEIPPGGDELTLLGLTMNSMLTRLRDADRSRRGFVSDAGHELRSPLTTLQISMGQLAQSSPTEECRAIASRAQGEVDRLTALVGDLLTLASTDERGHTARHDDIDLDDVVLVRAEVLRARGVAVSLDLSPVRIQGDAGQIERVVRNLLENAERHREREVRATVTTQGGHAVLWIDNDGAVVPLADRTRIFDRFVRLDDSRDRDTGGSGLGLAIVKEIAHSHGGEVRALESPDHRCRFEVRLPLGS